MVTPEELEVLRKPEVRECKGFTGYSIDTGGNVFSHRRKVGLGKGGGQGTKVIIDPSYSRKVKEHIGLAGYPSVYLQATNGKSKPAFIHRLVAEAFIPNPENKPCVNHINFDITDYSISNLEWVTYSENNLHSVRHGRMAGEKCNLNKLTKDQVLNIREICKKEKRTIFVARMFNVHPDTIRHIKRGKSWASI